MASTGLEHDLKNLSLIQQSYPQAKDADGDASKLSSAIFPSVEVRPRASLYSSADKTEVEQWLITSSHIASPSEDSAKTAERLSSLNTHLSTRTTLLGSKPSVADVAMYARLAPVVKGWDDEQRTGEQGYHHVVRWLDFVQNAPLFGLKVADTEKVDIHPDQVVFYPKPIDQKAEKERKKKEKALAAAGADTAAAAGGTVSSAVSQDAQKEETAKQPKKEKKDMGEKIAAAVGAEAPTEKKAKKEKQPKPQKNAPAAEKPLSPALIDLRVAHILKAVKHPEADSLYVSTVDCGDAPGTDHTSEYEGKIVRTVCSGLNGLVPLEEMQGRKIVAVCNLKPVKMRGIQSAAMVLAASPRLAPGEEDKHAGPVELVNPPADAEAGERVYFEGWEGEPEAQLNPKKKVWDYCQVGFCTTEGKEAAFDPSAVEQLKDSGKTAVAPLRTKQGVCSVKSLTGAIIR
ncbi:G4 quadruplex nucleic acid binding protein [Teratosphaeriaceae sp. CCFEE 6253]|nr:G4 quadruplex nucleic acid binding protein [Teratosphaeriaceae sp. CCFEE 6253]